jgi:hypothetical protein
MFPTRRGEAAFYESANVNPEVLFKPVDKRYIPPDAHSHAAMVPIRPYLLLGKLIAKDHQVDADEDF